MTNHCLKSAGRKGASTRDVLAKLDMLPIPRPYVKGVRKDGEEPPTSTQRRKAITTHLSWILDLSWKYRPGSIRYVPTPYWLLMCAWRPHAKSGVVIETCMAKYLADWKACFRTQQDASVWSCLQCLLLWFGGGPPCADDGLVRGLSMWKCLL